MNEVIITIPENFSIEEAILIREKTYKMIEEGERHFILDFHNCSFVDSTGLGVMVGIYKKCAEVGGTTAIRSVQPSVMKILTMTRLDKVFEVR